MGHEIEERADGAYAYVSAKGVHAWHDLGHTAQREGMTRVQMFEEIDEFAVPMELIPETVDVPGYGQVETGGFSTVRRDDKSKKRFDKEGGQLPPKVLGRGLSDQYKMVVAAEAFSFTDELVESGEAGWVSAGALREGRQVFGVLRVPRTITLKMRGLEVPTTTTEVYILTVNSFDASLGLGWYTTPVVSVCANTVRLAIDRAIGSYVIKHTGDEQAKLAQAREALGITFAYVDGLERELQGLLDTKIDDDEFDAFLESLVPEKSKNGISERNTRSIIRDIYFKAEDLVPVRGTRYAALQAVAEYVDHRSAVRNIDDPESRFRRSFLEAHRSLTPKAHELLAA